MANAVAEPRPKLISILRHPIYGMLLPVPLVCFIGVLLTDVTFLKSGGNLIWLAFSSWLLLAGLLFGAIAALVLLIDFIRSPAIRRDTGLAHMLFFYAALLVELLSVFIHERDGWTALAGLGLILSLVGGLLILIAGWLHRPAVRPVGKPVNFVTGFLNDAGKVRGRPVGATVDRTGALIIADDVGNAVWRVSYVGAGRG
jgi:uncharacterized membrane protein